MLHDRAAVLIATFSCTTVPKAESLDKWMRKLIEDVNRNRRLWEQVRGPSESLTRNLDAVRAVKAVSVPAGMEAVVEQARIAQGFSGLDRQLQIANEQYRELTTLGGVLEIPALAKLRNALDRSFVDSSTRKELEEASAAISTRFRFPELDELQKIQNRITETAAPLAALQDAVRRSVAAVEAIKTPWIDTLNAFRSLDSVVGLATLASSIHIAPYSPATIETVRNALGEWAPMSEEAQEDSIRRDAFYQEHGLIRSSSQSLSPRLPGPSKQLAWSASGFLCLTLTQLSSMSKSRCLRRKKKPS